MNKVIGLIVMGFANLLGFGFLMFLGLYDHTIGNTSLIIGGVATIAIIIIAIVGRDFDDYGDDAVTFGSMSAALMIILAIGLAPITADRGYCRVTSTDVVSKTRLKSINPGTGQGIYETKKDLDTSYAVDEDCMENPWSFQSTPAMIIRLILLGIPTLFILILLFGLLFGMRDNIVPKKDRFLFLRKDPWDYTKAISKYEDDRLELFDQAKTYMEKGYAGKDQFTRNYSINEDEDYCLYVKLANFTYDPSGNSWIDWDDDYKTIDQLYRLTNETIDTKEVIKILEWSLKHAEIVLEKDPIKKKVTGDIKEAIEKLKS